MRLKTTVVIEYDVNPYHYKSADDGKTPTLAEVIEAEQRLIDEEGGYLDEIFHHESVQTVTVVPA
jgi:hypothetical protein